MRYLKRLFVLCAVLLTPPAWAVEQGHRVALVVGISDYENAPDLANPERDAAAMAEALEKAGFDVTLRWNLDHAAFDTELLQFEEKVRGAEAALFFFAGHGIQVNSQNYLLASNAEVDDPRYINQDGMDLARVLDAMEAHAETSIAIIDACRDNPLTTALMRSAGETSRSFGVGRGLARLKRRPDRGYSNSLVAFATAPGDIALDGTTDNSPFTQALLRHVNTPDLEVSVMLKKVTSDVLEATDGAQRPEVVASMSSEFYFVDAPVVISKNRNRLAALSLDIDDGAFVADAGRSPEEIETSLQLSQGEYRRVQTILNAFGHDLGTVDGDFGKRSREALRAFQVATRVPETGYLNEDTIATLVDQYDSSPKDYDGKWILHIRRKWLKPDGAGHAVAGDLHQVARVTLEHVGGSFKVLDHFYTAWEPDNPFSNLSGGIGRDGRLTLNGSVSYLDRLAGESAPSLSRMNVELRLPEIVKRGTSYEALGNRIDSSLQFQISLTRARQDFQ